MAYNKRLYIQISKEKKKERTTKIINSNIFKLHVRWTLKNTAII